MSTYKLLGFGNFYIYQKQASKKSINCTTNISTPSPSQPSPHHRYRPPTNLSRPRCTITGATCFTGAPTNLPGNTQPRRSRPTFATEIMPSFF
ncbi:hypothetical protein Hanom_Chr04g00366061 [Helianthus anomalus]